MVSLPASILPVANAFFIVFVVLMLYAILGGNAQMQALQYNMPGVETEI
jgi:hypothetical protein